MSALVILTGKHKGRKIPLAGKQVLIGRDEECTIRLASTDISRQHCQLRGTPEGILVRDLGSSNGTFVNDVAITHEILLRPGDRLRVGPAEFEVAGARAAEAPAKIDDDIAEWLTKEDTRHGAGAEPETTILKSAAARPAAPSERPLPAPHTAPAAPPKTPPKPRKVFASVAEEAQDIIRRHLEALAEN